MYLANKFNLLNGMLKKDEQLTLVEEMEKKAQILAQQKALASSLANSIPEEDKSQKDQTEDGTSVKRFKTLDQLVDADK